MELYEENMDATVTNEMLNVSNLQCVVAKEPRSAGLAFICTVERLNVIPV
jgi:hypothetical protein